MNHEKKVYIVVFSLIVIIPAIIFTFLVKIQNKSNNQEVITSTSNENLETNKVNESNTLNNKLEETEKKEIVDKYWNSIITKKDDQVLFDSIKSKFDELSLYKAYYKFRFNSEERSYTGKNADSPTNTRKGGFEYIDVIKQANNYKTFIKGGGDYLDKPIMPNSNILYHTGMRIFMNHGEEVKEFEKVLYEGNNFSCSFDRCYKETSNYFDWQWGNLLDPNHIYKFLENSEYKIIYIGNSSNKSYLPDDENLYIISLDEMIRENIACKSFNIKLKEPIYIKGVRDIDENKARRAEIKLCVEPESGVVVALDLLAQSDAKSEDELHELLSWNVFKIDDEVLQDEIWTEGRFGFKESAIDNTQATLLVFPAFTINATSTLELYAGYSSNGEPIRVIDLPQQEFRGGEINKIDIDVNIDIEENENIVVKLCMLDFCNSVNLDVSEEAKKCLNFSLDENLCNKECFYNNGVCELFKCDKIQDESVCQERNCYWKDSDEKFAVKCWEKECENINNENDCKENACQWSNSKCYNKDCSLINKEDECINSSLDCIWNGFRCADFGCSLIDNYFDCEDENRCRWKEDETNAGDCNDAEEKTFLIRCPEEKNIDICEDSSGCKWENDQCVYDTCRKYTNISKDECISVGCEWVPFGKCISN